MTSPPMALDKLIGRHIRDKRTWRGMSVEELARQVRTTPDKLTRYESGEAHIPTSIVFEVACALIVPVQEFFEVTDGDAATDREAADAELIGFDDTYRRIVETHRLVEFFDSIDNSSAREAILSLAEQLANNKSVNN